MGDEGRKGAGRSQDMGGNCFNTSPKRQRGFFVALPSLALRASVVDSPRRTAASQLLKGMRLSDQLAATPARPARLFFVPFCDFRGRSSSFSGSRLWPFTSGLCPRTTKFAVIHNPSNYLARPAVPDGVCRRMSAGGALAWSIDRATATLHESLEHLTRPLLFSTASLPWLHPARIFFRAGLPQAVQG